nr:protein FAM53B-like [Nerophis lumbriciformis]
MVIIFSKSLEKKKGVNDVRPKSSERRPRERHTMSRGTTLFSCGTAEADRWLNPGRSFQSGTSLESLWDAMPEPGTTTAITNLIRDLSLAEGALNKTNPVVPAALHYTTTATGQAPTAPPSKRQCRSLSLSDEFGGFRSSWRPQGSRLWTAVEKRRCYSGGSVRTGGGFSSSHCPAMQRSSSFSFPSCTGIPTDGPLELPFFNQRLPAHPHFTASPVSPSSPFFQTPQSYRGPFLRPLSLSHEQISLPELQTEEASEASSPDSTPELGRRSGQRNDGNGCLSRSRSQPCVLNDKKIGMKRRRPEDAHEQRPSLDLAKMTQQLQTFQSLSCPGFSFFDSCRSDPPPASQRQSEFTTVSELGLDHRQEVTGDGEDSSDEEADSDSACSVGSRSGSPPGEVTLWKGDRGASRDIFQLGGELDLEQIERN